MFQDYSSLLAMAGEPVYILRPSISYDEAMDEVEAPEVERVENVLFGTPTATDIATADREHGMSASYRLCFPKDYSAPLHDCYVVRAKDAGDDPNQAAVKWKVITDQPPLPESLCPTQWNREVIVGVENG